MTPLERNKIYQIDCIDGVQSIPSNSVKLIVADPPYFLGMTPQWSEGLLRGPGHL